MYIYNKTRLSLIVDKPGGSVLLLCILCISLFAACSKSNSSQTRTLNQVETQLLGKWYVWKQIDSQLYYNGTLLSTDTTKTYHKTYTNFTSANYIEFKSGAYNSTAVAIGNLGLQCIDNSYGLSAPAGCASPIGSTDSCFWFYDDVDLNQLQINQAVFYIIVLKSDSLVLRYTTSSVPGLVKYNYNWCYLYR